VNFCEMRLLTLQGSEPPASAGGGLSQEEDCLNAGKSLPRLTPEARYDRSARSWRTCLPTQKFTRSECAGYYATTRKFVPDAFNGLKAFTIKKRPMSFSANGRNIQRQMYGNSLRRK